ncbi:hypothetical protein [Cognatilysobacter tabacisoli]|jgi:hypothetical protein|uniref:hypothetical protein n=1 Tax=Cognatilysobacter tabacisoli TaxID=2315424 RepID=UPI0013003D49|nr:hypothetical protein [Lysobacter tabacisoli]
MKVSAWLLLALPLACAVSGVAHAQAAGGCPRLPADTGLTWEHRAAGKADFCRALRADGSEAFGLYIADKVPFKPKGGNRAELGRIDGREIAWYRSEVAGQPNVETRETLVELPDGRIAHVWLQARSADGLRASLDQAQSMQFGATRLSSN